MPFATLYLVLLVATTAWLIWLSLRQYRYVGAHREAVPHAFADTIALSDHQKACDYTRAKSRLNIAELALGGLLAYIWTLGGGLAALANFFALDGYLSALAFMGSFALIQFALGLPLGLYATFGLEARFGFNQTTPTLWLKDTLKGLALTAILGGALLTALLWVMETFIATTPLWWLFATGLTIAFNLAALILYPNVIAPMFNKYEPLTDTALEARIQQLATRCGFTTGAIQVMDGSKRSTKSNAYFSGFGRHKKIVFFDTLLKQVSPDELEAICAHELGHFHHKHILKRLALMTVMVAGGFFALATLINAPWFYATFQIAPSHPVALLLFSLVLPAFTACLQPIFALASRRDEFEADRFAAHHSSAEALTRALLTLYKDNASTLTPDPLYSAWHHSHPSAKERIAALNALA